MSQYIQVNKPADYKSHIWPHQDPNQRLCDQVWPKMMQIPKQLRQVISVSDTRIRQTITPSQETTKAYAYEHPPPCRNGNPASTRMCCYRCSSNFDSVTTWPKLRANAKWT